MAHQQESFHPFSSQQSISCCLTQVARRSNPKPRGPNSCPSPGVPTLPKPRGQPLCQSCMVLSLVWLPGLGLNPSTSLPLQPHFRLLLQSVTPASIPIFFQLYWATIVSLGRCVPRAWSQSSPSSHAGAGTVTRGSCLPVMVHLGWKSLPSPGSKHGHSYLIYP